MNVLVRQLTKLGHEHVHAMRLFHPLHGQMCRKIVPLLKPLQHEREPEEFRSSKLLQIDPN